MHVQQLQATRLHIQLSAQINGINDTSHLSPQMFQSSTAAALAACEAVSEPEAEPAMVLVPPAALGSSTGAIGAAMTLMQPAPSHLQTELAVSDTDDSGMHALAAALDAAEAAIALAAAAAED